MPDISMCQDSLCPLASECYRQRANYSTFQSFTDFKYNFETESCESFYPMTDRQQDESFQALSDFAESFFNKKKK